jgi:hypothetical protein
MFLPSGSIMPSGLLDLETQDRIGAFNLTYANYGLKAGIVLHSYPVDDSKNLSKLNTEYDVAVIEANQDLGSNVSIYKNCISVDKFGGIADYTDYTYRAQNKTEGKNSTYFPDKQDGDLVLIQCLDGHAEKALIVGALKHPKRTFKMTKDKGHHYEAEFNGLKVSIDKEGAFLISFRGATDNQAKAKDEKVSGSFIKIEKDGSIELSDGNKEKLRLDKTKKTLTVNSEKQIEVNTEDKLALTSKDSTTLKMKDWRVEASGSSTMKVRSFKLESNSEISLKGSSFILESQGNVNLKGSQVTLEGNKIFLGKGGSPALTMNATWSVICSGPGSPMIISGPPISGLSEKVFIAP